MTYQWTCPKCGGKVRVEILKGTGVARSNHLRKHGINTLDYPRDKKQRDRMLGAFFKL